MDQSEGFKYFQASCDVSPLQDRSSEIPIMSSSKSATQITSSSFTSESAFSAETSRTSPDSASLIRSSKSAHTPPTNLLLTVPYEKFSGCHRVPSTGSFKIPCNSSEALFEEQSDLIITCKKLSSAVLGRVKSFSTSDLNLIIGDQQPGIRVSASDVAVYGGGIGGGESNNVWNSRLDLPNIRHLDATSRSCSTWVIVGDRLSSISQLPSPQTQSGTISPCPMDMILAINKKARQAYIKKRLLSTYRLLERLSRSQLNLANVVKSDMNMLASATSNSAFSFSSKPTPSETTAPQTVPSQPSSASVKAPSTQESSAPITAKPGHSAERFVDRLDLSRLQNDLYALTARDIEIQKGKPLSKYQRNMLIFNWLQNIDS